MQRRFSYLFLLTAGLAAAGGQPAFADATTEAQLRAALQNATAQIAQLEDQVANLQASQAPDVATIEALRAQLQSRPASNINTGSTENTADKAKNAAAMAALRRQLSAQQTSLNQSQTAYRTASSNASNAGQENISLKAQVAAANLGLGSCRDKNAQLFSLGNQILDAYSHKDDLFGAIADREPFTGLKRVQLQNIVQDDQDKLSANQIPNSPAP